MGAPIVQQTKARAAASFNLVAGSAIIQAFPNQAAWDVNFPETPYGEFPMHSKFTLVVSATAVVHFQSDSLASSNVTLAPGRYPIDAITGPSNLEVVSGTLGMILEW